METEALTIERDLKEKKQHIIPDEESPYNPEFVKKILQSKEEFRQGNYKTIKLEDLWK